MDEMTRRAYSLLEVKSVNDEERTITGIASTPATDRDGDIVEPKGAVFKLPLPLLWQHKADKPIGHVIEAKVTAAGIEIVATIAKDVTEEIENAWKLIKAKLVRGFSIGFRGIEAEQIPGSFGRKFTKWEWFELSAVTIPANAEASITSVKQFDTGSPAALGKSAPETKPNPGAAGKTTKPVILNPTKGTDMKTIAEQIAALEASRLAKSTRMGEVMQKSIDEGRSTDAAEQEEFDTLEGELTAIDGDLNRLRSLEKAQAFTAKPIIANQINTAEKAAALRSGISIAPVEMEKGIRFARYAKCIAIATKTNQQITAVAEQLYGKSDPDFIDIAKAAVSAMTTGNTAALVGNIGGFADFVEFLTPRTILGRFGSGNIPALSKIPFRTPIIGEITQADAQWVGEAKSKPLTRTTYGRTTLDPLKVATIAVQTMELIRDSSPSSDILIRNALATALTKRLDLTFLDPTVAAIAGVRPGSILNGVTAVTASTATGADGVREDAQAIMAAFVTANNPLTSGVWIVSGLTALKIMGMLNPLGQREFPGISLQGGTFFDLPVIVSNYVGDYLALVNAEDIHYGDEGGIEIAMSAEASLEMDGAPTGDSDTPTPAELVSMFQTNSVAFRAERTINWSRRRPSAVAWVDNPAWN